MIDAQLMFATTYRGDRWSRLYSPHSIEYTMEEGLSLGEIAESLLAQQALVDRLPIVLEAALPGVIVDHVKISLKEAEAGSLREEFLVAMFLAFQGDVEEEIVSVVQGLTGIEILDQHKTIVTLLVILVVLYGARIIYKKFVEKSGKSDDGPSSIQGDYNTVLNIAAKNLHVSETDLDGAVADAVNEGRQKGLWTAIRRFLRPAQKGGGSAIKAHGEVVVSSEAVQEFPSDADVSELEEVAPMTPLTGVRLRILALDRQKRQTGWAASFPDGEVDRPRVILDLYPTVSLDELSRAEIINADVIVEYDACRNKLCSENSFVES